MSWNPKNYLTAVVALMVGGMLVDWVAHRLTTINEQSVVQLLLAHGLMYAAPIMLVIPWFRGVQGRARLATLVSLVGGGMGIAGGAGDAWEHLHAGGPPFGHLLLNVSLAMAIVALLIAAAADSVPPSE